MAHIYLLTDPTGIRYVGVSVNPALRLKHHRYEAHDTSRRPYHFPKSRWIRKRGDSVRVRVLWTGTEDECYAREDRVISECRARGHDILNLAAGGNAPPRISELPDADAIRQKISIAASRRTASPETRRKMSLAHRGKAEHLRKFHSSENSPANKPVVRCLPDGTAVEVYRSSRAAAQAVGVSQQAMCGALKGRNKTCAGYAWRYAPWKAA